MVDQITPNVDYSQLTKNLWSNLSFRRSFAIRLFLDIHSRFWLDKTLFLTCLPY
jgi:hypothetical protein